MLKDTTKYTQEKYIIQIKKEVLHIICMKKLCHVLVFEVVHKNFNSKEN